MRRPALKHGAESDRLKPVTRESVDPLQGAVPPTEGLAGCFSVRRPASGRPGHLTRIGPDSL